MNKQIHNDFKFQSEEIIREQQGNSTWRIKSLDAAQKQIYNLPVKDKDDYIKQILKVQAPSILGQIDKACPKICKINRSMFITAIKDNLYVFSYVEKQQRSTKKTNKTFTFKRLEKDILPSRIQYIVGNGENIVFVSNQKQIVGFQIHIIDEEISVKEIFNKKLSQIKGVTTIKTNLHNRLIVLTEKILFTFQIQNNYEVLSQQKLQFSTQISGINNISKIKGIDIICQDLDTYYFVGSAEQVRKDAKTKLDRTKEQEVEPTQLYCEVLYITKITTNNQKANAHIFIIDFIFESGIFTRSRVHQVGPQTFILSLYEEIIAIKRNFSKFVVWDNVSVSSSKTNEKKGQLVLAGQRIMLFAGVGQIFAHQLYFDFGSSQFKLPPIDSIKGNDNEDEILYDGLIFKNNYGNYLNVLIYFKQSDISLPNHKRFSDSSEKERNKSDMQLTIIIIEQIQPTIRLKDLLKKDKTPEQIDIFTTRFKIDQITLQKSIWQVSQMTQKQIEGILLEIQDNDYIQKELTKILKKKPHDLQFLLTIQRKQIGRYQKMLSQKLLKLKKTPSLIKSTHNPTKVIQQRFTQQQIYEIKQIFEWQLQSRMFQKKLNYSQNFLSFKEYDFIEIGKLKAASLREEIKLLGCKGFEKRLKYFLNSFKYLILDDFKIILRFFLEDMNENQLKVCLSKSFPFVLPRYKYGYGQQICNLWQDRFSQDLNKIETQSFFLDSVIKEINLTISQCSFDYQRISATEAEKILTKTFQEFMNEEWFQKNAYKQHSLLKHSVKQLQNHFKQLKQQGVCNIIVELMLEKVQQGIFSENKVMEVIAELTKQKLFGGEFTWNMNSRIKVYMLLRQKNVKDYTYELPKKSQFTGMTEFQYFNFLFLYFKKQILQQIKPIYQNYEKGFFTKKFVFFLSSQKIDLAQLIDFLNFFTSAAHEDVRFQVFQCISRLLKISDTQNSKTLFSSLMEKEILFQGQFSLDKPIQQAKIALAHSFSSLFNYFNIENSYKELIDESSYKSIEQSPILKRILEEYCKNFDSTKSEVIAFDKNDFIEELPVVELSQILDFLAIILYYRSLITLEVSDVQILHKIMWELLENKKYTDLTQFMNYLLDFGKVLDQRKLAQDYPHYALLDNLKRQNNIKKQIQIVILKNVHKNYLLLANLPTKFEKPEISKTKKDNSQQIINKQKQFKTKVATILYEISETLTILSKYNSNETVKKEICFLQMLENIKSLSFSAVVQIVKKSEFQHVSFSHQTSFIFLINLVSFADPQIFDSEDYQQISNHIKCFKDIHVDFGISQKGNSINQQVSFSDYCRFNTQFIAYLADNKYFKHAAYSLFQLMTTTYYYRDIFFYLLGWMITPNIQTSDLGSIVYVFMTQNNQHELVKIFDHFLVTNQISTFCDKSLHVKNSLRVFQCILTNNQLDQAFFSLLRIKQTNIIDAQKIALKFPKYKKQLIYIHSLLIQFMRILKIRTKRHYPTFQMYKSKYNSLCKDFERGDIIKDIFIVMKQIQVQLMQEKLRGITDQTEKLNDLNLLKKLFINFMQSQGLNPQISIGYEKEGSVETQIEKFAKSSNKNQLHTIVVHTTDPKNKEHRGTEVIRQQTWQMEEERRKLLENQNKLREIREKNKVLMEQQITPAISVAKKQLANKEVKSLIQRKQLKQVDEDLLDIQKQIKQQNQELRKLFTQQADKIKQMKQTYQSKTVSKAREFLQNLRKRRLQVKQQLGISTRPDDINQSMQSQRMIKYNLDNSIINESMSKDNISKLISPRNKHLKESIIGEVDKRSKLFNSHMFKSKIDPKQFRFNLKESTYRASHIFNDKASQFYVPKRDIKLPTKLEEDSKSKEDLKTSGFVQKMKKSNIQDKVKQKKLQDKKDKKMSLLQIRQKYSGLEKQAIKVLEKLEYVKSNTKAGIQIIKALYSKTSKIENFMKICHDLLENIEFAKEIIEEKALKILQQAIKIQAKLPLQQIFPAALFVSIKHIALRDYYHIAYGIIKPDIIKLIQKKDVNINSLAVIIRYAFGSDNIFYYKIYEEYTRSLLNIFKNNNDMTQRELIQLSQKLRQNYNSLHPDNRDVKFQQLLSEISDKKKKKQIIGLILQNMEKKSSLSNQQGFEQIRNFLLRIQ